MVGQNVTQGKLRKVKVKPSPTTFHRCLKSKISGSRLKKVSIYLDKILIYLEKILITFKYLKNLDLSQKSQLVSTISVKISTISIKILTHLNLDWKVSISKISTEIKKKLISTVNMKDNLDRFQKKSLDTMDVLDLDWSRLSRPPGLILLECILAKI